MTNGTKIYRKASELIPGQIVSYKADPTKKKTSIELVAHSTPVNHQTLIFFINGTVFLTDSDTQIEVLRSLTNLDIHRLAKFEDHPIVQF